MGQWQNEAKVDVQQQIDGLTTPTMAEKSVTPLVRLIVNLE